MSCTSGVSDFRWLDVQALHFATHLFDLRRCKGQVSEQDRIKETVSIQGTMSSTNSTWAEEDGGAAAPPHFLEVNYAFAVVAMTCLGVAGATGTFGNLLIIVSVVVSKEMHNVESVFIVNLAFCDLYITLVAEPLSIVAKSVGYRFFEGVPGLCRAIGCLCTISCVGSLMTLSTMSCNRYILICHNTLYRRVFTLRNCLLMCAGIHLFGFFLVSLNFYGVGNHSFDHKSYECVWDRMASHDYTIVFGIVLVWVPTIVTGFAYSRTYLFVRRARIKVHSHRNAKHRKMTGNSATRSSLSYENPISSNKKSAHTNETENRTSREEGSDMPDEKGIPTKEDNQTPIDAKRVRMTVRKNLANSSYPTTASQRALPDLASLKLAKTLFIIYVVFSTCWIPYSAVIIFDRYDHFSHEVHAFVIVFAHLNASINWLVYYTTHSKLRWAFRKLLGIHKRESEAHAKSNTVFTVS